MNSTFSRLRGAFAAMGLAACTAFPSSTATWAQEPVNKPEPNAQSEPNAQQPAPQQPAPQQPAPQQPTPQQPAPQQPAPQQPAPTQQTVPNAQQPAGPAKPKTIQPKLGSIQADVTINAVFVPVESVELATDFKAVQGMRVIEAVAHGSTVNAGDLLVQFKTDSLKEQIETTERLVESLRLALEEAELDAKFAEIQAPMNKEQAELSKQQADEDYKYFMEVEKSLSERGNEERLKSAKNFLDYSAEEVKQLEQMYKADDLTEESEEIVLRRAKDDFERQKFSLEQIEANVRKSREFLLPRSTRDRINAHRLAEISYERFQASFPFLAKKRELSLSKARQDLSNAQQTLEKLSADLKSCEIKAPISGVVYYGRFQSGRWTGAQEMTTKLSKFGSVAANEVLMTIVNPTGLRLVGSVTEADISKLRVGVTGKATPSSNKTTRLDVQVANVSNIPAGDGSYRVALDLKSPTTGVVAGMTGSAKIVTYFNASALSLPSALVQTDEIDDSIRYVMVFENGGPVRKNVEVGVTQGDRIEIRSGLRAKDEVIMEKP